MFDRRNQSIEKGGGEGKERAEYRERETGRERQGSGHSFRRNEIDDSIERGEIKGEDDERTRKEDEPGPSLRFAASRKQDRPGDGGIDGGGLRWNAVVRFNDSELRP